MLGDDPLEQHRPALQNPEETGRAKAVAHVVAHPHLEDATLPTAANPAAVQEVALLPPDLRDVEVEGNRTAPEDQLQTPGGRRKNALKLVNSHAVKEPAGTKTPRQTLLQEKELSSLRRQLCKQETPGYNGRPQDATSQTAMQTFHKDESDQPGLRSMGDGFFVFRLTGAPRIQEGRWSEGGYLDVVVLRQIDLDLLWYKISAGESRLKTDGGPLSEEDSTALGESSITPMFIRTERTRWIFDLYDLDDDLAVLVSYEADLPDLAERIGEESARAIFTIKEHPGLKSLVNFR